MSNDINKQKMKDFITKLMSNPIFKNETPLYIEDHILLFLIQNYTPLKATLTNKDFFPDLKWNEIENLYISTLEEEINEKLRPVINTIVKRKIDFQFINLILNRQIPLQDIAAQFEKFIFELLKRFELRRILDSIIKIINYDVLDKYLLEIYNKRSYIIFELEKVERLRYDSEVVANYIKFNMFASLIGQIRNDLQDMSLQNKMNLQEVKFSNSSVQKLHYEKIARQYKNIIPYFPEEIILKSLSTNLSFIDDPNIPASCRMAKIFISLGKNYKHNVKVDKGAETFEKSWFQLQKKNYKYYGFDIKMIEELYRIAAENYW